MLFCFRLRKNLSHGRCCFFFLKIVQFSIKPISIGKCKKLSTSNEFKRLAFRTCVSNSGYSDPPVAQVSGGREKEQTRVGFAETGVSGLRGRSGIRKCFHSKES